MQELHREADKLFTEVDHLEHTLDVPDEGYTEDRIALALSIAKRVRRESNLLVRALARIRDQQLQPGGTS